MTPHKDYCRLHQREFYYYCPECAEEINKNKRETKSEEIKPHIYKKIELIICPHCSKKSLFFNENNNCYECLNIRDNIYRKRFKNISDIPNETNKYPDINSTPKQISEPKALPYSDINPVKRRKRSPLEWLCILFVLVLIGVAVQSWYKNNSSVGDTIPAISALLNNKSTIIVSANQTTSIDIITTTKILTTTSQITSTKTIPSSNTTITTVVSPKFTTITPNASPTFTILTNITKQPTTLVTTTTITNNGINAKNGTYQNYYIGLVKGKEGIISGNGCYDDKGDFILLINNKNAVNPTYAQLVSFLENDKTDQFPYQYTISSLGMYYPPAESYVNLARIKDIIDGVTRPDNPKICADFAERLHNNAEIAGIRCAYVSIDLADYPSGHACNAFQTTDKGLIYIDDTGAIPPKSVRCVKTVNAQIGQQYVPVSLFPEAGWNATWNSMGIIEDMRIIWDGVWN